VPKLMSKDASKSRRAGTDRNRHSARPLIAATRAAFDAFDREVADSRHRAERVLADLERWAEGGPVPSYAARYVAATEGDDRAEDEWASSELETSFDLHDLPLTLLADLALAGRLDCATYRELLATHIRDATDTREAERRLTAAAAAGGPANA
jgi:hypothetical protein